MERKPPKSSEKVFSGILGEIVRTIEPHTEADPMALLITLLIFFGNMAGKNSFYEIEAMRHFPNLFVCLVGESAKARKGTSKTTSIKIFNQIDTEWVKFNIKSGLASGEGLKYNVRDIARKSEKGQEIITDVGIQDKRLLIYESEFANALKVANRPGNTLSTTIRDAWDTGDLCTLTKNDPIVATGAHISILGHITTSELLKNLTETDAGNGYANRFLWLFVKRSKLLPFGGNISFQDLPLEPLKQAIIFAQNPRQVFMDEEAKFLWIKNYEELSRSTMGLLGSIVSRAEAQVIRLALVYALFDLSDKIKYSHLESALALWEYCEDSAKYIFGEKFGDDSIDIILEHLKIHGNGGITATELHRIFGNNKPRTEIDRAISELLRCEKIIIRKEFTTGRPTVYYELNEKN